MTTVLIPPLRNGAGQALDTVVSVRLVDVDGIQVFGFGATDMATEDFAIVGGATVELELRPQAEIAMPEEAPTFYEISVRTRGAGATYRGLQVPASSAPVDLRALVAAAAAVPSAALLAGRLLPSAATAPDGAVLSALSGAAVWSEAGGTAPEVLERLEDLEAALAAAEARLLPATAADGDIVLRSGGTWIASDTLQI